MIVDDTAGADADPDRDGVLVVFNATPGVTTIAGTGGGWTLHDVQAAGGDEVVKGATVATDAVTVPGRTTAVFER
jgi:hypothetical protein